MTRITVRRPDGTTEIIERPGTIIDAGVRRKMTEATRAAGKGEIIDWQIVKASTVGHLGFCCEHYVRGQGCPLHGDQY
jgi:hypothetical protein